jgi:hypothetical protein
VVPQIGGMGAQTQVGEQTMSPGFTPGFAQPASAHASPANGFAQKSIMNAAFWLSNCACVMHGPKPVPLEVLELELAAVELELDEVAKPELDALGKPELDALGKPELEAVMVEPPKPPKLEVELELAVVVGEPPAEALLGPLVMPPTPLAPPAPEALLVLFPLGPDVPAPPRPVRSEPCAQLVTMTAATFASPRRAVTRLRFTARSLSRPRYHGSARDGARPSPGPKSPIRYA